MKQYNYYKKINININNKNQIYHKNLFNNLLNIPEKLFKNLNVIDIGAGSGDTTIYFLENQANVTAVDYISDYFKFNQVSKLKNKNKTNFQFIKKDFLKIKFKKKFDLVCAFGWFFLENNHKKVLKKFINLTNKKGVIVLSYPDIYGSMLEICKKAVVIKLKNFGINDDLILKYSKIIFLDSYKKLKNSREFDVWINDCLLSPFLKTKYLIDTEKLIKYFKKQNFEYYSSSPRIHSFDKMSWYKNALKKNEFFIEVLNQYSQNKYQFMFGESIKIKNISLIKETDKLYFNFISYLLNSRKAKFDNRKFIKLISNLKKMNINRKNLDNLKKFYNDLLKENNLNNFVDKMKKNALLSNWGKSYFHLVLSRN